MSDKKQWGIIEIHGVDYHTVAKRVADFRQEYVLNLGWGTITKILDHVPDTYVVFRAKIVDPEGRVVAVGHAYENFNQLRNMSSSMLEVAETSAVGRALAFAGFAGTQSEIASADEVQRRTISDEEKLGPKATKDTIARLVETARAEDYPGCLEVWEELTQGNMIWINSQMDKFNKKLVGDAITAAREARDGAIEPDISGAGAPIKAREKDTHREAVRNAKG